MTSASKISTPEIRAFVQSLQSLQPLIPDIVPRDLGTRYNDIHECSKILQILVKNSQANGSCGTITALEADSIPSAANQITTSSSYNDYRATILPTLQSAYKSAGRDIRMTSWISPFSKIT